MKKKELAIEDASYLFKAIGEIHRLEILSLLTKGPLNVESILQKTKIEQSLLSKHLNILKSAELVLTNRKSRNIEYSLNPEFHSKLQKNTLSLPCCEIKLKNIKT